MTGENIPLEIRIGLNERDAPFFQLIDGDDIFTDRILDITSEYVCDFVGRGIGREIRKLRGPNSAEGRDYNIVMGARPCETSIYEDLREGINKGVQEQPRADRYESQIDQGHPAWYRTIIRF